MTLLQRVSLFTGLLRIVYVSTGNHFTAGRVLCTDVVVHLLQGVAKHELLYDYVLGTQWICRVPLRRRKDLEDITGRLPRCSP